MPFALKVIKNNINFITTLPFPLLNSNSLTKDSHPHQSPIQVTTSKFIQTHLWLCTHALCTSNVASCSHGPCFVVIKNPFFNLCYLFMLFIKNTDYDLFCLSKRLYLLKAKCFLSKKRLGTHACSFYACYEIQVCVSNIAHASVIGCTHKVSQCISVV